MIAPTIMPVRLAPTWGGVTGGTDTVTTGRDIVVEPGPVEPTGVVELAGIETAGRDIVDDAEGVEGPGGAAGAAARIPVVEAGDGTAPVAERIPVEASDPVAAGFGGAVLDALAGVAAGAADAVAAPADGNVVPH